MIFTSPEGVFLYNQAQDRFEVHENFNEILGGVRNIHRLVEDENGQIWFSVDDEFGRLDIAEEGFLKEVELEKFFFNNIQEQLVDGFENIFAFEDAVFIGTENGVLHYASKLDQSQDLKFEVFIRDVILLSEASERTADQLILPEEQRSEFSNMENAFRFVYASPFYESIGSLEYRYQLKGFSDTWSEWDRRTEKEFTNLPPGDYEFQVEARNAYGSGQ